jgi:hypothetical protein
MLWRLWCLALLLHWFLFSIVFFNVLVLAQLLPFSIFILSHIFPDNF